MTLGVTAFDISSKGLKYAFNFDVAEQHGIAWETYVKAIHNILRTQKFDSLPLIDKSADNHFSITHVARRALHTGDEFDVFILPVNETFTLPPESSILESIFSLLSNEHHIVFLKSQQDSITDVITISMLNSPLVEHYLSLLTNSLATNGWHWNNHYFQEDEQFIFNASYPKKLFSQIVELSEIIEHHQLPSDKELSLRIVKLLNELQPLKFSYKEGLFEEFFDHTFPLRIEEERYERSCAGNLANFPFGAIQEDDIEIMRAAFFLFAKANNWDQLLLQNANEKYIHLLQSDDTDGFIQKNISKIHPIESWKKTLEMLEKTNFNAIQVHRSPYPGVITASDFIFSDYTKSHMLERIVTLENNLRVLLLDRKIFVLPKKTFHIEYSWKSSISKTIKQLSFNQEMFNNLDKVFSFRNQLVHHYFPKSTNDDVPLLFIRQFYELEKKLTELEEFMIDLIQKSKLDERCLLVLSLVELSLHEKVRKSGDFNRKHVDNLLQSIGKITQKDDDFVIIIKQQHPILNILPKKEMTIHPFKVEFVVDSTLL